MRALPATGIGSWPGTSMAEAVTQSAELWDVPYLPELPARGPDAEMIGRALGQLDLGVERGPTRWRVAAAGRDQRHAHALLRDDLDILAERLDGYEGPLKVSLAGPYTLLASVDLAGGEPMVTDPGARRDLVQAHLSATADLVRRVRRLVPGADVVLQLDEPALGAVASGRIRSASGLRFCAPVDREEYGHALRDLVAVAPDGGGMGLVVHSCAPAPWRDLVTAGVTSLAVDADVPGDVDALAEHVDSGGRLWLGVVPTTPGADVPRVDRIVERTLSWLQPLELGARLEGHLVLTPACGLAGASPATAVGVARALREASDLVAERLFG